MRKAFVCSLATASGIPGLELAEIPEAAICVVGGNLQLVQPDAANELEIGKPRSLDHSKPMRWRQEIPDVICNAIRTGAPGPKDSVVHTIQLLDASIRGQSMNLSGVTNAADSSTEGMRFSGRCRATLDDGQNQWHAILRRNTSASRSGSPGKRGPLVPGEVWWAERRGCNRQSGA